MSCGTRAQYFRPGDPDGAWLLRSSSGINHLPSGLRTAGGANCSVACWSATVRQPAPSPVLRLLWLRTPLPNFPVRASAADAFTEVPLTDFAAGYRELHMRVLQLRYRPWRPLITAGHPVRSSVPSPSCTNPGSGTPPPHRPANCTRAYYRPAVRICQALLSLSATSETITTPPPNVYSSHHRFPRVRQRGNRWPPRVNVLPPQRHSRTGLHGGCRRSASSSLPRSGFTSAALPRHRQRIAPLPQPSPALRPAPP